MPFIIRSNWPTTDKHGETHSEYLFAPKCIFQLGRIIEATDAQIIISSSWKIPFEGETDEMVLNSLKEMWETRQYPGRIDGAIPNLTFQEILDMHCDDDFVCHKGFEIEQWLRQHPKCTSYVIIDDEEIVLPKHKSHFIQTDRMVGLQEEDADRAIEILCIRSLNPDISLCYI